MAKNKFIPHKSQKLRDEMRITFGGYTDSQVIEFENRKGAGQMFAWHGQNHLDENVSHGQSDQMLAPSNSYLSSPDMWRIAEEGRRRREVQDTKEGK